jgi:hypothetical protein
MASRQQEIDRDSFRSFLRRAAGLTSSNQQVIIATSESRVFVQDALEGIDASIEGVENGKLLRLFER